MLIEAKLIQVAKLYSNRHHYYGGHLKVLIDKKEKILKGSLDWIPSPSASVKIQIMCGKICLRCKGKTLLGIVL